MTPSSPIARAITELESERANLTARLAKVDAAIATLRDLFHLPAQRAKSDSVPLEIETLIRAALAAGPLSPGALSEAVHVRRDLLRPHLKDLERRGLLVCRGATAN